ncbi:hypothetical protein KFL_002200210, partial [Klebsormidium nitens]
MGRGEFRSSLIPLQKAALQLLRTISLLKQQCGVSYDEVFLIDLTWVGVDFTAADNTARHADVNPGRGEVILCAGTVGTPQLLVLSGTGPAGALEKLG